MVLVSPNIAIAEVIMNARDFGIFFFGLAITFEISSISFAVTIQNAGITGIQ